MEEAIPLTAGKKNLCRACSSVTALADKTTRPRLGGSPPPPRYRLPQALSRAQYRLSYDGASTSFDMPSNLTYLKLPDGQRLFLRPIKDNPELEIEEGRSLEGDLVFPGAVPAGTESVTLVMNEGNDGDDIAAPGIVLTLKLKAAE